MSQVDRSAGGMGGHPVALPPVPELADVDAPVPVAVSPPVGAPVLVVVPVAPVAAAAPPVPVLVICTPEPQANAATGRIRQGIRKEVRIMGVPRSEWSGVAAIPIIPRAPGRRNAAVHRRPTFHPRGSQLGSLPGVTIAPRGSN